MRKFVVFMLIGGLATGLVVQPASAKKKKKIHGSFEAEAFPLPNPDAVTGTENPSCFAGDEGVHKVSSPFTAPTSGALHADMSGFDGDWDLALADEGGNVLTVSANEQVPPVDPAEEEVFLPVVPKQNLNIVACNWIGERGLVEVHWMFVPK